MENNTPSSIPQHQSKEIDLIGLYKKIYKRKNVVIISVIIGTILGIIVAINNPKTFTSYVVLAPEISSGSSLSGNLADLASNFGVDLSGGNSGVDAIYPEIYPEIFSSKEFLLSLFDVPIRSLNDNKERTYFHHLTKEINTPFWEKYMFKLMQAIKPTPELPAVKNNQDNGEVDSYLISKKNNDLCNGIAHNISCMIENNTSVITISVTDQDALVAAILADTLQLRLQKYITHYRTNKSTIDYNYYNNLYLEAKQKYEHIQKKYADYCDANQDLQLTNFIVERDALENDMQTAYNVMAQLQTQVQTAKAKIQENTPAFTILSQPKISYKPSSMPKIMIMFIGSLLGLIFSTCYILLFGKEH